MIRRLLLAATLALAAPLRADEPAMDDYLLMQKAAEPFKAFGDTVTATAARGDVAALAALFSPTTTKANGAAALDTFLRTHVVPFFAGWAATEADTTITPTHLPNGGPSGFALYKRMRTKDGASRPYILYVLREDGRLVVANALLGKTYRDMHPEG